MSIDIVKEEINEFLNSNCPEVISIRGVWGIGKTYLWRKLVKEAKQRNGIKLKSYSYVSVFGINSISELKMSIFEALMDSNYPGENADLKTFLNNPVIAAKSYAKKITKYFQSLSVSTKNVGINSLSPLIDSLCSFSITDTIICLDDFERIGQNLSLKDVLGLVSRLKEQKNCKVALIFNEDYLRDGNLKDYEEFREKVIDTQLLFNPSPEDIAEIAYQGDSETYKKLKEYSIKLKINNIRILKKIERLALKLEKLLEGYNEEILNLGLQILTLFSWSFFSKSEHVPNLDYIINMRVKILGFNKENVSEKENEWNTLLREYGYNLYDFTHDFDQIIVDTVKSGYFNKISLMNEAKKLNRQMNSSKSYELLQDSWKLYHDSFDNNEAQVVETLYKSFNENYMFLSPNNLDAMIRLFRKLGKDELANEAIKTYVDRRNNEIALFDLSSNPFSNQIEDQILIDAFANVYQSSQKTKEPKIILEDYLNTKILHDKEILLAADIDFYYHLFKSEKGKRLSSLIDACILFGINNAIQALKRIGKESKLNEARIAKYGISINNET